MVYVGVFVFVCFALWALQRELWRTKQMKAYASRRGFIYIGAALPRGFPFDRISVRLATSIYNVVAADWRGKEILIFDCALGSGKGRRLQTVLAVRRIAEPFEVARFGPNMAAETVGEWTLIYRRRRQFSFSIEGLLSIKEIEDILTDVGDPAA